MHSLLDSLNLPIPSLIGFVDSQFNLEKIAKIYRHPYLLPILENLSKDETYTSSQHDLIEVMITTCKFVQLGVEIDHFLGNGVRSALFSHVFQSNNTRNNQACDSNRSIFIPLEKDKNKIVENLNSLRTAGQAATAVSEFDLQITFRQRQNFEIMES